MASLNKVFLIGNLTRDPELRYTPGGQAVCHFTLAVNRSYNDKAGQKKEEAAFLRVTVWGKQGEACAQYLSKGRSAFVEGRLQSRSWETDDGQKRSAVDVVAERIQFLPRGGKGEETTERGGGADEGDAAPPEPEDDIPF